MPLAQAAAGSSRRVSGMNRRKSFSPLEVPELTTTLITGRRRSGGGGGYWNHPYGYNNGYNQQGSSWYNGRGHGAEGSEYHNRVPGDN
jgi:hypothetical protein